MGVRGPCIRIVASDTSSRRLDTSFVTVHSCDVSLRAMFWVSCRKYSVIAFFKPRMRTIILNWLVHLFSREGWLCGVERVQAGVAEGDGVY